MSTTSSPTSTRHSRERRRKAAWLWLGLSGLLAALAFWAQSLETESDAENLLYEPAFAISAVVQYGILLLAAYGIARFYTKPLRALGFRRFRRRWVWLSFAVVVLTVIVGRILEPFLHGGENQGFAPDHWEPQHAAAFGVNVVVLILLGPFVEEVFFRGLGVRVLAAFDGTLAVVVTGIVFGLVHGILGALPPLALFGMGLGWVRLRSASVWPGFIAHATYNGLGILLLVLAWATDQPVS
jgi:membrane protease YdiL (CAAX protease family)